MRVLLCCNSDLGGMNYSQKVQRSAHEPACTAGGPENRFTGALQAFAPSAKALPWGDKN